MSLTRKPIVFSRVAISLFVLTASAVAIASPFIQEAMIQEQNCKHLAEVHLKSVPRLVLDLENSYKKLSSGVIDSNLTENARILREIILLPSIFDNIELPNLVSKASTGFENIRPEVERGAMWQYFSDTPPDAKTQDAITTELGAIERTLDEISAMCQISNLEFVK